MKTRNLLAILIFTVAGFGAAPAFAQNPLCENFDEAPDHFKELYQQARELGRAICMSFGEKEVPDRLKPQFVAFAQKAAQVSAAAFATTDFSGAMRQQMRHFESLAASGVNKDNLPSFITFGDNNNLGKAEFFGFNEDEMGLAWYNDAGCMQSGGASCKALLQSLKIAIEQYKRPYVNRSGENLARRAGELMSEWDRYFEQARAQTLLDAVLTTAMAQDHLAQSKLVGPMEKQWFVVHPSIVIENVSAAADGDELSEALAIEWIGVNWWDGVSSPIGYPFGVSLASVYSDRAEVEEVGHGLMLHFGNSISIGVTDHDGDTGVAVTVDFLSLMAKKKQHWEDYKKGIETIIENEKQQALN